MNWVKQVVAEHAESEAPERFFYWAALAAISATVRKNVSLDRFYYRLYPNIYVFLVAKSGMKKSIPITMCKGLLTRANCTRVVSGRTSIQAVLKDFGKACSLKNGAAPLLEAHGILLSGELASFLVEDPAALTILTDLHDTHAYPEEWINNLKIAGIDKLKAPCIQVLGATNEEHFSDAVPANAIGGGFIARTFIVFSDQRGKLNSLTERPKLVPDLDKLTTRLLEIKSLKGDFIWADSAKKLYDAWYYAFMSEPRHDPTGTYNRIGDQVIKVAMLLALGEGDDLVLTKPIIEEALVECLDCTNGMKQITMGAGAATLSRQTKLVLRDLISRPDHKIERQRLLQKYWGEFDAFDLDRIIETLLGAGAITKEMHGTKVTYTLKKDTLDAYTSLKRSIQ